MQQTPSTHTKMKTLPVHIVNCTNSMIKTLKAANYFFFKRNDSGPPVGNNAVQEAGEQHHL